MALCEPLYSAFASASLPAMSSSMPAMSLRQQLQEREQQRRYVGAGSSAAAAATAQATAAPAQPQHQPVRPRSSGCRRCITCVPMRYMPSATAALAARRSGTAQPAAAEEWWPGGLSTPTLYFQLRRRQLQLQCTAAATSAGSSKLWRPAAPARHTPSPLLARRGARPLALLIPTSYTNVQPSEARVQLIAVLEAPRLGAAAAPGAHAAAAAASKQLDLLLCCSTEEALRLKAAPASPLPADAAREAATAAAAAALRPTAAALLQRVQRAPSLPSPAKRTRLDGPAAAELHRPSPFAAVATQQAQPSQQAQQQQAQWGGLQPAAPAAASFMTQQAQQVQEQAAWWLQQPAPEAAPAMAPSAAQLSRAASLEGVPECTAAGATLLSATGAGSSGRASLCLSSRSFASEASGVTSLFNGSQPLPSASSVLPPPPAWAGAAPAAPCGPFPAAFAQHQHQQWQWQAQAQAPFAQLPQQQQQQPEQGELYWQRLHAIRAERAYPVVLELPPVQPAVASEQGVAAALSSLLRLLSKRKGE